MSIEQLSDREKTALEVLQDMIASIWRGAHIERRKDSPPGDPEFWDQVEQESKIYHDSWDSLSPTEQAEAKRLLDGTITPHSPEDD